MKFELSCLFGHSIPSEYGKDRRLCNIFNTCQSAKETGTACSCRSCLSHLDPYVAGNTFWAPSQRVKASNCDSFFRCISSVTRE